MSDKNKLDEALDAYKRLIKAEGEVEHHRETVEKLLIGLSEEDMDEYVRLTSEIDERVWRREPNAVEISDGSSKERGRKR